MHVYKLPSGHWRAVVQFGGRRRSATAKTKREAQSRGAALYVQLGGTPDGATTTLRELLDAHLADQSLRGSTIDGYRLVRARIPDGFEDRPVTTITPPVIDAIYRTAERAGASAHQIRKLNSLLSGAFGRAVRWGLVPHNPCRDADVPAEPEPDVRTPSEEEARALLAAADGISPQFGLFCRLAAQTGARPGELLALQRGDIADNTVRIARAASRGGGTVTIGPTKTGRKGVRVVAIGPTLAARIDAHVLAQDLEMYELGGTLGPDAWLFSEDQRAPWYPSTPTHWWARARKAVGIDDVRMYDLRHFVATELFAGGFDEQTAMRRLGHTNPVTTGKRYATSRPARDRAAAAYLEERLER